MSAPVSVPPGTVNLDPHGVHAYGSVAPQQPDSSALYQHLLNLLGARDHTDAARIIAGHHLREIEQPSAPEPVAWSTSKPTFPGAYWVRGYCIGSRDDRALVEVRSVDGQLCCNLHCINSDNDDELSPLETYSPKFEWLGPLHPAPQQSEGANPNLCPACKTWPVDGDECPNCGAKKPFDKAPLRPVTDADVEKACRAVCAMNGWNPDEPVTYAGSRRKARQPDGSMIPQWQMHERAARTILESFRSRLVGEGA